MEDKNFRFYEKNDLIAPRSSIDMEGLHVLNEKKRISVYKRKSDSTNHSGKSGVNLNP